MSHERKRPLVLYKPENKNLNIQNFFFSGRRLYTWRADELTWMRLASLSRPDFSISLPMKTTTPSLVYNRLLAAWRFGHFLHCWRKQVLCPVAVAASHSFLVSIPSWWRGDHVAQLLSVIRGNAAENEQVLLSVVNPHGLSFKSIPLSRIFIAPVGRLAVCAPCHGHFERGRSGKGR